MAHTSAYVVDRSTEVPPPNHYDVTVSSGEAPKILDLLTRLEAGSNSLVEGYENVNVEDESVEQQNNDLNEAKKATIFRSARDVGCKDPSEEQLRSQLLQAKFFGGQITEINYNDRFAAFEATFGSPYSNTCTIRSSGDLVKATLNKRSSCPWTMESDEDDSR